MPYNSETSQYERRATTVIDATPDGDTVAVAIDVKLDQGIDDYVTDLNHHNVNGNHFPATSVGSDSRFLKQSPAGVVSWADGVVAADAALKDFSNVASGAIAPAKITQDAANRFMTDAERTKLSGVEAGAQKNSDITKAEIEAKLTGTDITSHGHSSEVATALSAGAIVAFAMSTAPTGFLKANGAAISRTTYSALFAKIGTTYGAGNGSTTFNLPDLRGEFIRGWDDGRGADAGRAFGSNQSCEIQAHSHTFGVNLVFAPYNTTPQVIYSNGSNNIKSTNDAGGPETRPRNIALLVCIKY